MFAKMDRTGWSQPLTSRLYHTGGGEYIDIKQYCNIFPDDEIFKGNP